MHMRPYRRTQTGFTLIEITVVLVIFGVLLAFAVLGPSRAGRDEVVDRTAAHVSAAIRYLAQDAIFRARPVGLDFSRNAMTPKHYDGEKWHDINDPPLASFEFDADIALEDANGEVHYAQGDPDLIVMPTAWTKTTLDCRSMRTPPSPDRSPNHQLPAVFFKFGDPNADRPRHRFQIRRRDQSGRWRRVGYSEAALGPVRTCGA